MISPTDIHDRARKLWATGQPLRALLWTLPNQPAPLSGLGTMQRVQPFFPCLVPFRKPTAQEWLDHFADLRAAAAALEAQSKGALGAGDTITFRETAHQKLGRLRVPERITFECIEDLAVCAGESDTVRRFRNIVRVLEEREPRLLQWLADRPSTALEVEPDLVRLLDAAAHFQAHPRPNRYARELGIAGVDRRFIEGNRALLSEWLDRLLPANAIDGSTRGLADHGFERRYGLRFEEAQIRFRWLDVVICALASDRGVIVAAGLRDPSRTWEAHQTTHERSHSAFRASRAGQSFVFRVFRHRCLRMAPASRPRDLGFHL